MLLLLHHHYTADLKLSKSESEREGDRERETESNNSLADSVRFAYINRKPQQIASAGKLLLPTFQRGVSIKHSI